MTKILVSLPKGFYIRPELGDLFGRLEALGKVRKRSHETETDLQEDLAWCDAVITGSWPPLTPALLDAAPQLRFRGHLDLVQSSAREALARDVAVSISRHGYSPAVSELALGLMIGMLRRVSDYHAAMRAGTEQWAKKFPEQVDPLERELTGRDAGIIGFGRVGRRLAELLVPFRPKLRIFDPYVPDEVATAAGAQRSDLHHLVRSSDLVVICAASNPGSRHLLGREELALFREDAILINVARAALVDTDALIEKLRAGRFYAAIDVFDREPLDQHSALRTLPNAYLTPHRAGGLMASARRVLGYLVDDLEAFLAGRPLQHPLRPEMVASLDG